ncbi:HxlR family transcriptional regulator [Gordoniibacillus kamchatkensis]|uniref:HxlR family transcriptional regulator n=1 Tax=Gordoniibacillus kamchatkensis TaxID=1590651 RepID=A0ABR5AMB9_9BACL|nr:helix-turn-helix domain-containing protein [Paenibacillus sp. VKM B-2647]KIL42154.1 HxlR family transcriptional regulator [Paenibacillus sp. VKM B-2647]
MEPSSEVTDSSSICDVLRILGAKWAFLVIAELAKGPKRFNRLLRDTAVIRTQSLTDTLRHLEQNGIVRREVYPTVPVTVEYSLTDKGSDFQAALREMEKWALKWGQPQQTEKTGRSS